MRNHCSVCTGYGARTPGTADLVAGMFKLSATGVPVTVGLGPMAPPGQRLPLGLRHGLLKHSCKGERGYLLRAGESCERPQSAFHETPQNGWFIRSGKEFRHVHRRSEQVHGLRDAGAAHAHAASGPGVAGSRSRSEEILHRSRKNEAVQPCLLFSLLTM